MKRPPRISEVNPVIVLSIFHFEALGLLCNPAVLIVLDFKVFVKESCVRAITLDDQANKTAQCLVDGDLGHCIGGTAMFLDGDGRDGTCKRGVPECEACSECQADGVFAVDGCKSAVACRATHGVPSVSSLSAVI